jgi:hypothetical protein
MTRDDVAGAERQLALGIGLAEGPRAAHGLALAVLHCTRAELRLCTRDGPPEALADPSSPSGAWAAPPSRTRTCSA